MSRKKWKVVREGLRFSEGARWLTPAAMLGKVRVRSTGSLRRHVRPDWQDAGLSLGWPGVLLKLVTLGLQWQEPSSLGVLGEGRRVSVLCFPTLFASSAQRIV